MALCERYAEYLQRYLKDYGISVDTKVLEIDGECIIDFKNEDLAKWLKEDCEEICSSYVDPYRHSYDGDEDEEETGEWDYEDYEKRYWKLVDECTEECKNEVEHFAKGSLQIDYRTRTVVSSTIPISCSKVFSTGYSYGDEEEDVERPWRELRERLIKAGCEVEEEVLESVHQHEFARDYLGSFEPEEEMPAICFIHPRGCRPEDIFRAINGK